MMNSQSPPVIFGEVLFDCFPDGSRILGGAPFNVAWHSQAFGLAPLFISRVGDDELGQEILLAMREWGMETQGIQIDAQHKTGIVDVTFNDGEPSYNIVNNSAWDFIDDKDIPEIKECSLLYHGSLTLRNSVSENSLTCLKQSYADSIFVDINLRPPWWDLQKIKKILKTTHWLKLNQDELALLVPGEKDVEKQARYLIEHYKPELVVVTLGEAGAIAVTATEMFSVEPDSATNIIDTVGAGDAFSSVLVLGLHKGWPLQKLLNRAQIFASHVVGLRGATTQDRKFYQPFIRDWSL
ncbi:MAG: carbohydrate kinase [Gammaproteobacteria bacterium]|nr:carbohydrate kinase [Gammaproteobacteria bacterium]MCW8986229.1 carbohydrate kinase [Gammaproteobacteria bacterium]